MSLVKSKQRVADHGEVFTPAWMVEAMLDLVKGETERLDTRCLEPACGDGNFPAPILRRKLAAVEIKFGKSDFEKRHYALLAVMCIYGIELLPDNIAACRANLLEIFAGYLNLEPADDLYRAAFFVLSQNLVHGDAMKMCAADGSAILFAEWGYLVDVAAVFDFALQPVVGEVQAAEASGFIGLLDAVDREFFGRVAGVARTPHPNPLPSEGRGRRMAGGSLPLMLGEEARRGWALGFRGSRIIRHPHTPCYRPR